MSLRGFGVLAESVPSFWGPGLPPVCLGMIGAGCRTGQDRARLGANAEGQSVQSDWCHKKGQALPRCPQGWQLLPSLWRLLSVKATLKVAMDRVQGAVPPEPPSSHTVGDRGQCPHGGDEKGS